MGQVSQDDLWRFIEQVRLLGSINFPHVAKLVGHNWFKDIKPLLDTNKEFREGLMEVLECLKYELYQKLLETGRDGKKKNGRDPEIQYINAVIKHIDSGAILSKQVEQNETEAPSAAQIAAHLKRMGLKEGE